jgi:NADH:ubiquinone oxidoreductase subunit 6 (subunit J)
MLNNKIFSLTINKYYYLLSFFISIFLSQVSFFISTVFSEEASEVVYSNIPFFTYDDMNDINVVAQVLYNYYNSCFLLAGLVLLVAMIGAIYLTLTFISQRKTELLHKQLSRSENHLYFFY